MSFTSCMFQLSESKVEKSLFSNKSKIGILLSSSSFTDSKFSSSSPSKSSATM